MVLSLSNRFGQKLCSLEDCKDLKTMSVYELINSLNIAELRQNMRSGRGVESALVADFRSRARLGVGQSRKGVDRFAAT